MKEAIRINPKDAEAHYYMGNALKAKGDPDGAAASFREANRLRQEQREGAKVGSVHDVGDGLKLQGKLDAKTTTLVYEVKLTAGKTYVIDMVSPDQQALDPFLVLKDADRQHLAEDDDGGDGLNARLTYRAPRDGVYRIHATSYKNAGSGNFTLTVRAKK